MTANNNPTIALSGTASGFAIALTSCQAWRNLGYTADGSYSIDPDGAGTLTTPANAYCDMDGANGWTLIAYNNAPTTFTNFTKTWAEYKAGFGSPASGTLGLGWIGNDRINALTSGGKQLKVQIDSNTAHFYEGFTVANEANKYRMTFSTSASPNAADAGMFSYHSGYNFTTHNSDNDAWGSNCASYYAAGWWYQSCYYMTIAGSNTNRVYWRNSAGDLEYVYSAISMWVK